MPYQSMVSETMENRRLLEEIAQYPVVGMASQLPSQECADALRQLSGDAGFPVGGTAVLYIGGAI